MTKPGSWGLRSEKDPRWNMDGRSASISAFYIPEEAKEAIEEMKKKLNQEPPDDLEISAMKD
jgi:hypothetical protein